MEFGPDGLLYASMETAVSPVQRSLRSFDPATGALVHTIIADGHMRNIGDIEFGPDGQLCFLGTTLMNQGGLFRLTPGPFVTPQFFSGVGVPNNGRFTFGFGGDLFFSSFTNLWRLNGSTGEVIGAFGNSQPGTVNDIMFGPTAVPSPAAASIGVCSASLCLRRRRSIRAR